MQTEIIFYNPSNRNDCAIQNVTSWTVRDINKLKAIQGDYGRTEHKIRTGYPVFCSECDVFITLSPIERPNALCDSCLEKAENQMAIAEKIIDEYKPY